VDTIVDDRSRDAIRCRWLVDAGVIDYSVVNEDGSSDAASCTLFPLVDFCVLSVKAYSHRVVILEAQSYVGVHIWLERGEELILGMLIIQLDVILVVGRCDVIHQVDRVA